MVVVRAEGNQPLLSDRLNRVDVMTRTHKRWLAVLAALMVVDMADLNTFAYAAPGIRADWGLSVGDVGTITAASFLGMFAGSIVGGRLADRFGRKRIIVAGIMFFSTFSLLSAFAVGVPDLVAYRILTGFGLQAVTVVLLAYVSEMFPRHYRGRAQTWILAVSLLGIPAMAWLARWVVPMSPSAWRWVFVLGASGILLIPIVLRFLPESVRWLQENEHHERAEAVVAQLEAEAREVTRAELPAIVRQPVVVAGRPRDLIRGGYLKRTAVLSICMSLALSGFYGFNSWVPTLLVENGFSTQQSLTYTSWMSLAAVPGALIALLFVDRFERRNTIFVIYLILPILMLTFGFTNSTLTLVATGTLITMTLQMVNPCWYTYLPEIFPTNLRALGAGLGNGLGRLAVFGTTFLVAALLGAIGFTGVFIYLASIVLLAGIIMRIFGERTHGRSLEDIARVPAKVNKHDTNLHTRTPSAER